MSLVAYASSDDDSSNEEIVPSNKNRNYAQINIESGCSKPLTEEDKQADRSNNKFESIISDEENDSDTALSSVETKTSVILLSKLPAPKAIPKSNDIEEENDEFLHKKEIPIPIEKPPSKKTVKITIPSLSDFKDVANEKKTRNCPIGPAIQISGLLSLLPKPKYEQSFLKSSSAENSSQLKALVPDSVKTRQEKKRKDVCKSSSVKSKPKTAPLASKTSDSEESDAEDDFFSLNSKLELPEVSASEINSMVARQAAKMEEASAKFNETVSTLCQPENEANMETEETANTIAFDEKALQALVGSSAKRRKVQMNVVELSSDQVLPNKDEWLRSALAQATTYQPKGVLVDEETVPGTRKKHQITYLAHQAKANEQELQAMWATNRHTRRQTQSKYGF